LQFHFSPYAKEIFSGSVARYFGYDPENKQDNEDYPDDNMLHDVGFLGLGTFGTRYTRAPDIP